jgi:quinol-cytochrome oxidoreductase complex cytochrome b subunit
VIPIKVVGIMVPIVGVALLVVWPFLDRNPEVVMRRRKIAVAGATVVIVGLIVFTIWGYVS